MCAESDHEEFWDGVKPIPKLLLVKTQAKFRGRWFGSPDAILNNADLSGADLSKADISDEQLAQCSVLKGATMPDGTKHP